MSDGGRYNSATRSAIDVEELGRVLFEQWALPFEIVSIVLIVALIGAVVIGRAGPEEDEPEPGPGGAAR